MRENAQDTEYPMVLKLDVLAQHIMGRAVAGPFDADQLYDEVTSAFTYRNLSRDLFDQTLDYVATGGYALKSYERYAKLRREPNGLWRLSHPRLAQQYRLNIGTIVEDEMIKVRIAKIRTVMGKRVATGGFTLGELEEWFIAQLSVGDTYLFSGQVLRHEGIDEYGALATRAPGREPRIPSYQGGKFPLSTFLAARVRRILSDPSHWGELPPQVRDWLSTQRWASVLPSENQMLVETFRAPTSSTWSAIPSRAAWRSRRWACCSPAASNAGARGPLASSHRNMRLSSGACATWAG